MLVNDNVLYHSIAGLLTIDMDSGGVPRSNAQVDDGAYFSKDCLQWQLFPVKREVLANKDSDANGHTEPKALVMAVPQAYGETAPVEAGA